MFEQFKAAHGGLGPARFLLDQSTGGALSFRAQRAAIGQQMDDTLAAVRADDLLSPEAKAQAAGLLAHGVYSAPEALKNIQTVQHEAGIQHTIGETFGPMIDGAQKIFDDATTPEDKSIASSLLGRAQRAAKLAADPLTRQQGMDEYAKVNEATTAFATTAKANKITADTAAATMARDLTKEQIAVYQNSRENFQKESQSQIVNTKAWQSAQDIAKLGDKQDAVTDQNLIRLAATVLNPGVATRPGEDPGNYVYDALNVVPGLGAAVKYATTNGGDLTHEARAALMHVMALRVGDENAAQIERNTAALHEADALGLPDKYKALLTLPPAPLNGWDAPIRESPSATAPPPTATPGSRPPAVSRGAEPDTTAAMVGSSIKEGVKSAAVSGAQLVNAAVGDPYGKLTRYQEGLRATAPRRPQDEIGGDAQTNAGAQ